MLTGIRSWLSKLRKGKLDGYPNPGPYLYRSGWDLSGDSPLVAYENAVEGLTVTTFNSSTSQEPTNFLKKKMDERLEKKPVEVFKEIISETPTFSMVNIDAQIAMVERRKKMLKELGSMPMDEEEALGFLKARKKSVKAKADFRWATTNFDMVRALTKKYKLAYVEFSSYSKTIPMEAIDELEAFMEQYSKVRDDKPVLKLIIDDIPTKEHQGRSWERKKDPILLASSPFGKWFYILGAWDKEVEVVDDLIYHGK